MSIRGNVVWLTSNTQVYRVGAAIQQYQLDGESCRDLTAIDLEWQFLSSRSARYSIAIEHADLQYDTVTVRDSTVDQVSLSHEYKFTSRWQRQTPIALTTGRASADEDSQAALANTERDFVGYRLSLSLTPYSRQNLSWSYMNTSSEYAAVQTYTAFSAQIHTDDLASSELKYSWLLKKRWRFDINYLKDTIQTPIPAPTIQTPYQPPLPLWI